MELLPTLSPGSVSKHARTTAMRKTLPTDVCKHANKNPSGLLMTQPGNAWSPVLMDTSRIIAQ